MVNMEPLIESYHSCIEKTSFCIQRSGKINIAHENSHFTLLMFIFIYFNELLQLQLLLKVVDTYVILLKKKCLYLISPG